MSLRPKRPSFCRRSRKRRRCRLRIRKKRQSKVLSRKGRFIMQNQAILKSNNRNLAIMIAAFAAIYILWGSTYLAIKYAIETLPPFIMAGSRFLIAGGILFGLSIFFKD